MGIVDCWWALHKTLLFLKGKQKEEPEKRKKPKNQKQTARDLMRLVNSFKKGESYLSLQKNRPWVILWGLPIHHR